MATNIGPSLEWKNPLGKLVDRWVHKRLSPEERAEVLRLFLQMAARDFSEEEILWHWMEAVKEGEKGKKRIRTHRDLDGEITKLRAVLASREAELVLLRKERREFLQDVKACLLEAIDSTLH